MYRSTRRLAVPVVEPPDVVSMPDRSGMLSSLEAVRREVREIGDEYIDAVLQLITECALSLTAATGAALAFLADDKMICRARAGQPAPPLGAPVDVRRGLSGECVRSGRLVSCEDTENDPRIDPEVSRVLGIASLMAAPIVSNFRVVGLLEVFSPHARGFTKVHETVLDRLVEMIPKIPGEKKQPENAWTERTQPETPISPEAASGVSRPPASELGLMESGSIELGSIHATHDVLGEQRPEVPEQVPEPVPRPAPTALSKLFHWALLGLAFAVAAMAAGYLVGSMIGKR
jgi:putative methionine-R-sulfoxide reductase with GAF domain